MKKIVYEEMRSHWIRFASDSVRKLELRPENFDFAEAAQADLPFCHQCFRQIFLWKKTSKAVLHIAARTLYKCHINGKFVMTGPARSPAGYLFADEFDISGYLQEGKNVIAVEIVYTGPLTEYDYGNSGFSCILETEKQYLLKDGQWRVHEFSAYSSSGEAGKLRATYPSEKIDFRKLNPLWTTLCFDDSAWLTVKPEKTFEEIRKRPFRMPDLSRFSNWQIADASGIGTEGETFLFRHDSDTLILDFGRSVSGLYELDIKLPSGAVMSCLYLEWFNTFAGAGKTAPAREYKSLGFSMTGDGKRRIFQTFHPYSTRYLKFRIRFLRKNQKARLFSVNAVEICSLPRFRQAHAVCSDPVLNRIVEAAQNTLRICTPDMYVDCSSKERRIYLHDSLWEAEAGALFFNDTVISRAFLDMTHDCSGRIPACPGMIQNGVLCSGGSSHQATLSHNLTWILQMFRHYRFTGETPEIQHLKTAIRILEDAAAHTAKDGLLEESPDINMFFDWSKMYVMKGASVAANALYYKVLVMTAEAVKDTKLKKRAESLRKIMRELTVSYLQNDCWRNSRLVPDLFLLNAEGRREPYASSHVKTFGDSIARSETTQYYLLWSGLLEKDEEKKLWEILRELRINEESRTDDNRLFAFSRSGLFGLWIRLSYALETGDDEVVCRDVRDIGEPMILEGDTLWETLCYDSRTNAHGFSAAMGSFLYYLICGILPGEKGFKTPVIAPRPVSGLDWGGGFRNISCGVIRTRWFLEYDEFRLEVDLPEGIRAKVRLPKQAAAILSRSGHRWKPEMELQTSSVITVNAAGIRTFKRTNG